MKNRYPFLVLVICWTTWFWSFSYRFSLQAVLPQMQELLALSTAAASLLLSVSYWGNAVSTLFASVLSRLIGKKNILMVSLIVPSSCLFIATLTSNYLIICIMIFLAGLGFGLYLPNSISLLSETFTHMTGTYIGLHETAAPVGQVIGPLVVGVLFLLNFGWIESLRFWTVPAMVILLLFYFLIKEPRSDTSSEGSRLRQTFSLPKSWTPKTFLLIATISSCHAALPFAFAALLPLYWTTNLGVSVATAAFILGVTQITSIAGQFGAGYLCETLGHYKVIFLFRLASSVLLVSSAYLPFGTLLVISLLLFGPFANGYFPALLATISKYTPPEERSKMVGVIIFILTIFGSFASTVTAVIADLAGFTVAWLFPISISIVGLLLTIPLKGELTVPSS